MNQYKLSYFNDSGCYRTEYVHWSCFGKSYTLQLMKITECEHYIIAEKVIND
jgi:hypothetical protein